jgi:hypothetical protein
MELLNSANYVGAHLEIGTAAGGTLKELMSAYPDPATRPLFQVVDPMKYFPDQLSKVYQNLSAAGIDPESVMFRIGTTSEHFPKALATGEQFDFIFIDGDHRPYPVILDLKWAELLNEGGTIDLHDDSQKFPGVGWAISRFLNQNTAFTYVSTTGSMTILRKNGPSTGHTITSRDLLAARVVQIAFRWRRSLRKRTGWA